eukprot:Tbor_TRINITY_DN2693_c0_g1::TRINITY_DN2693_c0_g1_i1::g.17918::m.17918
MQDKTESSNYTSDRCTTCSCNSLIPCDNHFTSPHSRHASYMERLFDIYCDILPSNFVVGIRISSSHMGPSSEELHLSMDCLLKQHPLLCSKLVRNYDEGNEREASTAVKCDIAAGNGVEKNQREESRPIEDESLSTHTTTSTKNPKNVTHVENKNTRYPDPNKEFVLYIQCHDPKKAPEMNFVRELVWNGSSLVPRCDTVGEENPRVHEELNSATFGPHYFKSFVENEIRHRMDHFGPRMRLHYVRFPVNNNSDVAGQENTTKIGSCPHSEGPTSSDTYLLATFDHVTCDAMSAIKAIQDLLKHLHTILRVTNCAAEDLANCPIDDVSAAVEGSLIYKSSSINQSNVGILNDYYHRITPIASPGEGVWRPANYTGLYKSLRSIGNVIYNAFNKNSEVTAECFPFEKLNKENAKVITLQHVLSPELSSKLVDFAKNKCGTTLNGLLCAALAKSAISVGSDTTMKNKRWNNGTQRTRINNTVDLRRHFEPYANVARDAVGCYIRVAFQAHNVSSAENLSDVPVAAKRATDQLLSYIHNGDAMTTYDPLFGSLLPHSLLLSALGKNSTEQAKKQMSMASSKVINGGVCLSNLGVIDRYFTDESITDLEPGQKPQYSVDSFYFCSNPGAFASCVLGTHSFKGVISLDWTAWEPSMTAERLGLLDSSLVALLEKLVLN